MASELGWRYAWVRISRILSDCSFATCTGLFGAVLVALLLALVPPAIAEEYPSPDALVFYPEARAAPQIRPTFDEQRENLIGLEVLLDAPPPVDPVIGRWPAASPVTVDYVIVDLEKIDHLTRKYFQGLPPTSPGALHSFLDGRDLEFTPNELGPGGARALSATPIYSENVIDRFNCLSRTHLPQYAEESRLIGYSVPGPDAAVEARAGNISLPAACNSSSCTEEIDLPAAVPLFDDNGERFRLAIVARFKGEDPSGDLWRRPTTVACEFPADRKSVRYLHQPGPVYSKLIVQPLHRSELVFQLRETKFTPATLATVGQFASDSGLGDPVLDLIVDVFERTESGELTPLTEPKELQVEVKVVDKSGNERTGYEAWTGRLKDEDRPASGSLPSEVAGKSERSTTIQLTQDGAEKPSDLVLSDILQITVKGSAEPGSEKVEVFDVAVEEALGLLAFDRIAANVPAILLAGFGTSFVFSVDAVSSGGAHLPIAGSHNGGAAGEAQLDVKITPHGTSGIVPIAVHGTRVVALAPGKATITISSTAYPELGETEIEVTVTEAKAVRQIAFDDAPELTLSGVGVVHRPGVYANFVDEPDELRSYLSEDVGLALSSSNESILVVEEGGFVRSVGAGEAVLYAAIQLAGEELPREIELPVVVQNAPPVVKVSISPNAPQPGEEVQIQAQITDDQNHIDWVRYYVNGQFVGESVQLPHRFRIRPGAGELRIEAETTDGLSIVRSEPLILEIPEEPPGGSAAPSVFLNPRQDGRWIVGQDVDLRVLGGSRTDAMRIYANGKLVGTDSSPAGMSCDYPFRQLLECALLGFKAKDAPPDEEPPYHSPIFNLPYRVPGELADRSVVIRFEGVSRDGKAESAAEILMQVARNRPPLPIIDVPESTAVVAADSLSVGFIVHDDTAVTGLNVDGTLEQRQSDGSWQRIAEASVQLRKELPPDQQIFESVWLTAPELGGSVRGSLTFSLDEPMRPGDEVRVLIQATDSAGLRLCLKSPCTAQWNEVPVNRASEGAGGTRRWVTGTI